MNHLTVIAILCSLLLQSVINSNAPIPISNDNSSLFSGPYIDEILFMGGMSAEQRYAQLVSGTIDIDNEYCDYSYLSSLPDDLQVHNSVANRSYHIIINCEQYPLNISGFRRAFAFAFNKTGLCEELNGTENVHDSLFPSCNSWCIEDELPFRYYEANPELGNQILDDLGFSIDTETGYRLAPNGAQFGVYIYAPWDDIIADIVSNLTIDALESLHIISGIDDNSYLDPYKIQQGNFDMALGGNIFNNNDIENIVDDYASEYVTEWYINQCRFSNYTFDLLREQILSSSTYEETYEFARDIQLLLHENVPELVLFEPVYHQLYRNDTFCKFIPEVSGKVSSQWTSRSVRLLSGVTGGRLVIGVDELPVNYNIFTSEDLLSRQIFDLFYSSLYDLDPNLDSIPDLAQGLVIQTHDEQTSIPIGHSRYTIDIIENATWSDGHALTAEDVVYTFTYLIETSTSGNPASANLENLVSVYAPITYRVVFEFNTESYLNFFDVAFRYIIPKHIFNDPELIGIDGWNTWNPIIDSSEPLIVSGPFLYNTHDDDELLLEYNPSFYYALPRTDSTTTTTDGTTVTATTTPTFPNPDGFQNISWLIALFILVSAGSLIVIIHCIAKIHQYRLHQTKNESKMDEMDRELMNLK